MNSLTSKTRGLCRLDCGASPHISEVRARPLEKGPEELGADRGPHVRCSSVTQCRESITHGPERNFEVGRFAGDGKRQ